MSISFDREGATLGRSPENTFHLPDPHKYISRKHAIITYEGEDGLYYLTDKSVDGTFILNRDVHVHHDKVRLADGDRLKIGDYELVVSIVSSTPKPNRKTSKDFNPIELLKNDRAGHSPEGTQNPLPNKKQKSEQTSGEQVPDDSKTPKQSLQDTCRELPDVFFEAAGIADTSAFHSEEFPELLRIVGAAFRELSDGLITILRGRQELKKQFRVTVTILETSKNNPFKFARNVDEALKLLLTKNHHGFVDASEAAREAFTDIVHHQLAMTAGIQTALIRLLKRFDPQQFTKQFEENGVVFQKKSKCWDAYNQAYSAIAEESLETFLGEDLARGYEEQILKLRSTNNRD